MAILFPRISASCRSVSSCKSSLFSSNISAVRCAFFGNKPIMASDVKDFPQPDSPTTQRISPRPTCRFMLSTACKMPWLTGISIDKFFTSKTTSFLLINVLAPMLRHADRPQISLSLKLKGTNQFQATPITRVKRTYILFPH